MTALIRAKTDELVVGVVGSDLRSMGFRKKARTWWRRTPEVRSAVSYRGSWTNTSVEGLIFVRLDFDFAALGDDLSGGSAGPGSISFGLERLGPEPGHRLCYRLTDAQDPHAGDDVRAEIERDWSTHGLPLVRRSDDLTSFVEHLTQVGNTEQVRAVFDRIAEPLRDTDLQHRLITRGLAAARDRQQWRYLEGDRHPLELGLQPWSWLFERATSLEVPIEASDQVSASAVLADAADGMLATRFHTGSDERAAAALARYLKMECPSFAEMAPGNESI